MEEKENIDNKEIEKDFIENKEIIQNNTNQIIINDFIKLDGDNNNQKKLILT